MRIQLLYDSCGLTPCAIQHPRTHDGLSLNLHLQIVPDARVTRQSHDQCLTLQAKACCCLADNLKMIFDPFRRGCRESLVFIRPKAPAR